LATMGKKGATNNVTHEPQHLWPRIEQLSRAAMRITAVQELDKVLQEVVDSAREVIGARYAALGILNEDRSGLGEFVASGMSADEFQKIGAFPEGKGVLGLLIKDPKPMRVADLSRHPDARGFPLHHPGMRSFLGVPIRGRQGPIGNLYLAEKAGAPEFSEEDEAVAVMLAGHAAVAVENARLLDKMARLLAELRTMQASRERFFAMINHELRNALTAVYGWADLWLRKTADDPPRAAIEVHESAEQTLMLLEDLLQLSRLEADRLLPVVQDADARVIVQDAIRAVQPAAERKGVRITTTGVDESIECRTDAQRVRQILINLLTNAVRHSPADEEIRVEVRSREEDMRFDVVDHGEGIAAEEQATIFEAFERGKHERERGTGLGLALSRQLARLLGGELRVESQLGHGARFLLELPRRSAAS